MRRLMVLLACLLLISACTRMPARAPDTPPAAPKPEQADGFITIRLLTNGDLVMESLIAAFQEQHPGYRIEQVPALHGEDFMEQLKATVKEGKVDVLYLPQFLLRENASDFLDLSPYIAKSAFDLTPLGPLAEDLEEDGRVYTLPLELEPKVLVYNPDLFAAAGVAPPKTGWTWEDFRSAARRLTGGEGDAYVWGFYSAWPTDLAEELIRQKTGGDRKKLDAPVLNEVMQLLTTMTFQDRSMTPAPDIDYTANVLRPDGPDRFKAGQAGMSIQYMTGMLRDRSLKAKWDVAPWPVAPGAQAPTGTSTTPYGIAANTPDPDAAWAFLRFAAGPEGAVILARGGSVPAYRTPEAQKAWFDQSPSPPPGTAVLFRAPFRKDGGHSAFWMFANRILAGQLSFEQGINEFIAKNPY